MKPIEYKPLTADEAQARCREIIKASRQRNAKMMKKLREAADCQIERRKHEPDLSIGYSDDPPEDDAD